MVGALLMRDARVFSASCEFHLTRDDFDTFFFVDEQKQRASLCFEAENIDNANDLHIKSFSSSVERVVGTFMFDMFLCLKLMQ